MIIPIIIICLGLIGIAYNLYLLSNPSRRNCELHFRKLRELICLDEAGIKEIYDFYDKHKKLVPHYFLQTRFQKLLKLYNSFYVGSLQ